MLPGDASVEVDGQPAYRRDGAIDLIGKVGDVRHVRVWKGTKAALEKEVKIQEIQPSPPLMDFNEASPVKQAAKRKGPVSFGAFDD